MVKPMNILKVSDPIKITKYLWYAEVTCLW